MRAIRAEQATTNFETAQQKKDQNTVTVLGRHIVETERSMFCVAHDITERKLAGRSDKASERELEQSREYACRFDHHQPGRYYRVG